MAYFLYQILNKPENWALSVSGMVLLVLFCVSFMNEWKVNKAEFWGLLFPIVVFTAGALGFLFFLDADFKERVRRRHKELKETVQGVSWEDVEKDLRNRDTIDSSRKCAPLKQAKDAIYIDTTEMTIEGTVDILYKWINP